MSSVRLTLDLESFINEGLSKGWRGWPVKSGEAGARIIRSQYLQPAPSTEAALGAEDYHSSRRHVSVGRI